MSKWYEEAIFYHIYPLGLLGAPGRRQDEGEETVHRLRDLDAWVDHMKDLGFTATYIGPLFESTSHGYDTKDYRRVDSRLGDNEDFRHFVEKCHENGIRVVVDGVFNHTGREFFAFQDLQKNREHSPYASWYQDVNFQGNSPFQDGFWYRAWHDCYELANLNLWNPEVRNYLLDVVRFWIDEFDIDGIRLDCADCLHFDFMKELRRAVEEKKQDFWLMGEVIMETTPAGSRGIFTLSPTMSCGKDFIPDITITIILRLPIQSAVSLTRTEASTEAAGFTASWITMT